MRCGAFDEGFYPATGDFAAEGDCESAAADFVDIVWLRVAGFAAAVDYVVELFAVSAVEYSGEVFYLSLGPCILAKGKRVESGKVEEKRRGRGGGDKRSRPASACTNLSLEQASANSGANQANCGRALSTSRSSEARLFS